MIQSDAYRALSRSEEKFDLIISEPSNPWVVGVEMLYSKEFLALARNRLSEGGVFAQWFHTYETDDASLELILRTFDSVFEHTSVWQAGVKDLIIMGFQNIGPAIDYHRLIERTRRPDYKSALERAGIGGPGELLAKESLPVGTLHAAGFQGPIHTLYHPLLNYSAGRAFFRRDSAQLPFTGHGDAARVGAKNSLLTRYIDLKGGQLDDEERAAVITQSCRQSHPFCVTLTADWLREGPVSSQFDQAYGQAIDWLARNRPESDAASLIEELAGLFDVDSAVTASTTPASAWKLTELFADFYYHVSPFDPTAIRTAWSNCGERNKTRERCMKEVSQDSKKSLELPMTSEADIEACMKQRFGGPICNEGSLEAEKVLAGDTSKVRLQSRAMGR